MTRNDYLAAMKRLDDERDQLKAQFWAGMLAEFLREPLPRNASAFARKHSIRSHELKNFMYARGIWGPSPSAHIKERKNYRAALRLGELRAAGF